MNVEYLKTKIGHLKEQRERAVADANRFRLLNDSLIEDNEALQKEVARLRAELADERDRYDRLSDFELAEAKELAHAKLMFNIAFSYLDQTGYDVEKLGHIVALRTIFEERGLV